MKNGLLSIFILISMIALAAPTRKQLTLLKNDVVAVKATLKSGKNLAKSEATVRKYLADTTYCPKGQVSGFKIQVPEGSKQVELQSLLCDVLKKAYQVGNEKMYLRTGVDTTCLVKTGRRMFIAYQQLDSLDARERHHNSQYLLPYRTNIFMGGLYFLHKKEWLEAWHCFDLYLQCAHEPLFSDCHLSDNDSLTYKVSFLSLVAASQLDSLPFALKYADRSVCSTHREDALQQLCEITHAHKDSADYEHFLRMGFKDYPTSEYFFPHLIDMLDNNGNDQEALSLCDQALKTDSANTVFLLGKHNLLMSMKQYDDAIEVGNKLIALDDSLDTPYYNIGYIYHKRAMDVLNTAGKPYRQRLAAAQKLFRRCRPYMERYRKLRPYDRSHWRPILYDVYLNLNMGKEFAEVES